MSSLAVGCTAQLSRNDQDPTLATGGSHRRAAVPPHAAADCAQRDSGCRMEHMQRDITAMGRQLDGMHAMMQRMMMEHAGAHGMHGGTPAADGDDRAQPRSSEESAQEPAEESNAPSAAPAQPDASEHSAHH